jgi:hypothetical protein
VILGGGETVESMRLLHKYHPHLDPAKMHWRCVELLRGTSDAAAELLGFQQRIWTPLQLDQAIADPKPSCYLVDVSSYYHPTLLNWIPQELLPPENWNTTSDSLAWLLALRIHADELQLIKKPDSSSVQSIEQAAQLGLVDPHIATLSNNQPNHWKLDTFLVYPKNGWNKKQLF